MSSLPKSAILLLVCLAVPSSSAVPAETNARLNARDFGASGSKFESKAATNAGSKQITVANVGDFTVGQGVLVSKANPRIAEGRLWGPRKDYAKSKPVGDLVQLRGYDGSAGSWLVYVLGVPTGASHMFRWSDDLGRTWHEIRDAIRKHKRIFQTGTHSRFHGNRWPPCERVRGGYIGKVHTVQVAAQGPKFTPSYTGPLDPQPVPEGFDWDMGQGPEKRHPYNPGRVNYLDFYLIWDYCAGFIGNWGVTRPMHNGLKL